MTKNPKDLRQKELEAEEQVRLEEVKKNKMFGPIDIIREKVKGIEKIRVKLAEEFPTKK